MNLTILGGGGFRVPLVIQALGGRPTASPNPDGSRATTDPDVLGLIDTVTLYDTDEVRLETMRHIIDMMAPSLPAPPKVIISTNLHEAICGADFVFSAMRVDGTAGRIRDEAIPMAHGILGQETVGPGGLAFAMRTIPFALEVADLVKRETSNAWVINFTNPAGIITQAMRATLGNHVVGICDSPIGLVRRTCWALGVDPDTTTYDYVGLNHLGWLRRLEVDGVDVLGQALQAPTWDTRLDAIEEVRHTKASWVHILKAIPNEYLAYYYWYRDNRDLIASTGTTRGRFLHAQQQAFYEAAHANPSQAYALWIATHQQREDTYMSETKAAGEERTEADIAAGGYQHVALSFMQAVSGHTSTPTDPRMILGVPNERIATAEHDSHLAVGSLTKVIDALPQDAIIEVPVTVDTTGAHAHYVPPVEGHMLGLMATVKEMDTATIAAVVNKDPQQALKALALHPFVDSVSVAQALLDDFCQQDPLVAQALGVS